MFQSVYWYSKKNITPQNPLSSDQSADVAIVGGGLAGLTAAQILSEAGKSVVILEQAFCGAGASGKNSGFITPDSEIPLRELIETKGDAEARRVWEFVVGGVHHLRTTIEDNSIDCDYQVQDSLYIAKKKRHIPLIHGEYEARNKLGYKSKLYKKNEIPKVLGTDTYYEAVRYPDTFGMNPFMYCQNLKRILESRQVKIFENTPVTHIAPNELRTEKAAVRAKHIIFCGDRFIPQLGKLNYQIYQAQTFLSVSKTLSEEQIHMIFPEENMLVWDSDLIYHYFRIIEGNRLLVGGSNMFYTYLPMEKKNNDDIARSHRDYIVKRFPKLDLQMEYVWPGMLGVSQDFLPICGSDPAVPNTFYIGAASGMPWAAALGRYTAEKILSGRDDFDAEFSPYRHFTIHPWLQKIMGKPAAFAIAHGIKKLL
ncbi:MAG: FAD dependent oxidoreductase [Parcubacteria group bacterium Gr01-1014_18]|nr:MAG: FAD dependent oxidoreductase [Parcubacteria group bacterium Greene0416_36]TSC80238.1 MAG: FAD dependent oxidoreductase [Parcubacteria group bacterium Gr01-1014_18]TSC98420.1 MAG: FAD dependent oxidoreductase [Parcubacteria group bacterium Greene1014_20]TSD06961.1 MAG: FAD dependent oxidoreductase [Parcubacteria group bacterium Greene0714_2]